MIKRIILFLLLLGVLGFLFYGRDIPPPDDSMTIMNRVDIPDEENAYTYFLQATNHFVKSGVILRKDYLSGKGVPAEVIEQCLAQNGETLILIQEGLLRPYYQSPVVYDSVTPVPHISAFLGMGKLLVIRAKYLREHVGLEEAQTAILNALHYGNIVASHPEGLVEHLIGLAVYLQSLEQLNQCILHEDLSLESVTSFMAEMEELRLDASGFKRSMKTEYQMSVNTLMGVASGKYTEGADSIPFKESDAASIFSSQQNT